MRWARCGVALAFSIASAAGGQPAVPGERPTSAQALLDAQPKGRLEELLRKHFVLLPSEGLPKGQVEALVIFAQPPDKVWPLLLQRERQREYRPELTSVAVIERTPD